MGIISDTAASVAKVASSPQVAIPVTGGVATFNLIAILPIVINFATITYLTILIAHKLWSWYKEYKGKIPIDTKDENES